MTDTNMQEVIDVMVQHKMAPATTKLEEVEDYYCLRHVIAEHYSQHHFAINPEGYGEFEQEAGEDYEQLMQLFSKASNGTQQYDDLSSTTKEDEDGYSREIVISFTFNGQRYQMEFDQDGYGISEEFLSLFLEFQTQIDGPRIMAVAGDNGIEFALVPKAVHEVFEKHDLLMWI